MIFICQYILLFLQQASCCAYGASTAAAAKGTVGGYDCLMIPGMQVIQTSLPVEINYLEKMSSGQTDPSMKTGA